MVVLGMAARMPQPSYCLMAESCFLCVLPLQAREIGVGRIALIHKPRVKQLLCLLFFLMFVVPIVSIAIAFMVLNNGSIGGKIKGIDIPLFFAFLPKATNYTSVGRSSGLPSFSGLPISLFGNSGVRLLKRFVGLQLRG